MLRTTDGITTGNTQYLHVDEKIKDLFSSLE
jgi:hypothetical protein